MTIRHLTPTEQVLRARILTVARISLIQSAKEANRRAKGLTSARTEGPHASLARQRRQEVIR